MTKLKLTLLAAVATLRVLLLVCAAGSAGVLGSTETLAQNAYITNQWRNYRVGDQHGTNAVIATDPCWQLSYRRHGHPGRWECLCR